MSEESKNAETPNAIPNGPAPAAACPGRAASPSRENEAEPKGCLSKGKLLVAAVAALLVWAMFACGDPDEGDTKTVKLPGGAKMTMVWCPKGSFVMGSPELEPGRDARESPQHQVTLTKGFWIAQTEVTRKQWLSVMGSLPTEGEGDDLPVEKVSWRDCVDFCLRTGLSLPTEAEWEYACRAGSTGPFAGTGKLPEMAWFKGNSEGQLHPVGKKEANAWGLFDMHGNVGEWCLDRYGEYAAGDATDPFGAATGSRRVARGGASQAGAGICRSAFRIDVEEDAAEAQLGFRPVLRQ